MEKSDFELYYHKGGTYILPIETFNEIFDEMEGWKKDCKQKENIIKEVREYISNTKMFTYGEGKDFFLKDYWYGKELLEILDKIKELKGSAKE